MGAETIQLGGRWYKRVGVSTLEHDHWLAGHLRHAGSGEWMLRPGESHEDFGGRILGDLMASGKAFPVLGGLLMPSDEEKWTREMAQRTADEMAGLTNPEEKRTANLELLSCVMEFFVSGLAYWLTSEGSSEKVDGSGKSGTTTAGSASGEKSAA